MKHNIGDLDRNIRLTVGMVLLVIGIMLNSWLGIIGGVLLASVIVDWCPLYAIFRIDTCKHRSASV